MLKHGHSKVLNAQLRGGVVVVGCQYGLVVLWDLEEVLSSPYFALDIDREFGRLQIEICSLQCREKQEVINFQPCTYYLLQKLLSTLWILTSSVKYLQGKVTYRRLRELASLTRDNINRGMK